MIVIQSRGGFTHKYYGSVELIADEDFIYIESHETIPRQDEDELNTWRADTFDVFVATDIMSIRGQE